MSGEISLSLAVFEIGIGQTDDAMIQVDEHPAEKTGPILMRTKKNYLGLKSSTVPN